MKEEVVGGGAPTMSVGGGHIAGAGVGLAGKPANWGEPGVSKKAQRRKQKAVVYKEDHDPIMAPMLTRRAPSFAGVPVFEVSSTIFHNLVMEKRKGKHWRTYLEEDDCYQEIREFANKNKGPLIVQNSLTKEMRYIRYK